MKIIYKINGVRITRSKALTDFGAALLERFTDVAVRTPKKNGLRKRNFWLEGTGFFTIIIEDDKALA